MNERIRELDKQARLWAIDNTNFPISSHIPSGYTEKFAELIVRECGNWFNSRLVVEPDYGMEHRIERNRAVVGVMKEFNQHFGVVQCTT